MCSALLAGSPGVERAHRDEHDGLDQDDGARQ